MSQEPPKGGNAFPESSAISELDPENIEYIKSLLTQEMLEKLAKITDWDNAVTALALAALHRIRRLWSLLFGHQYLSTRIQGDEELYQLLRHALLFQLESQQELHEEASRLVPDSLLQNTDLQYLDYEIRASYEADFQLLESTLLKTIIKEGHSADVDKFQALFATHDDWLNSIDDLVTKEYDRESTRLGLKKTPDSKRLNLRIENVELRLRKLIAESLGASDRSLPQHVLNKILERKHSSERKNLSKGQYTVLELLDFTDIRELETIMVSKQCNHLFSPTFGNKQLLERRFDQLAELRNCFRHSRTPDSVILDEGKASIVWLERALEIDEP